MTKEEKEKTWQITYVDGEEFTVHASSFLIDGGNLFFYVNDRLTEVFSQYAHFKVIK